MKHQIFLLILVITFFLLQMSCKKEPIETEGEKVAAQLNQVATNEGILYASPFLLNSTVLENGTYLSHFSFKSQFIIIGDIYYNLNKMYKFEIKKKDTTNYFVLYFQNQ